MFSLIPTGGSLEVVARLSAMYCFRFGFQFSSAAEEHNDSSPTAVAHTLRHY